MTEDSVSQRFKEFGKTGTLDLSGELLTDLHFIGSRVTLKRLNLSFTHLNTLEGLACQPHLESLIMDSSDLTNLKNFRSVQTISSVSVRNTPLSLIPNYKLSLLIVIGPVLRTINGATISEKLRTKAKRYPDVARDLVNCGWMATYPCPEDSELEEMRHRYCLNETSYEDESTKPISGFKNMEQLIEFAEEKQEKMLSEAQGDLDRIEQKDIVEVLFRSKQSFTNKVVELLRYHGFEIDEKNLDESILDILSRLLANA